MSLSIRPGNVGGGGGRAGAGGTLAIVIDLAWCRILFWGKGDDNARALALG